MNRQLLYISNSRLPTEKAHGFQIAKTCEALADLGMEVSLWHPRRRQTSAALATTDVFAYYGVKKNFVVQAVANLDVYRLQNALGPQLFRYALVMHAFFWGLFVAIRARSANHWIYYTRDTRVAIALTLVRLPTLIEFHQIPQSQGARQACRFLFRKRSLLGCVAVTTHIATALVRLGANRDRVAVLPDAADPEAFAATPPRDECRELLGIPKGRAVVGYVGRFQTMGMEKGIPQLIEALGIVAASSEERPLLVCVGGPLDVVDVYRELARTSGITDDDMRFVDRVPNSEVPLWLKTFDIAAMPFPATPHFSLAMSPLKLFEYMAAGLPIVSTRLPSLEDVLRDGVNALLVAPDDVAALGSALRMLLSDRQLRERLGAQALRDSTRYTWRRRAQDLSSFFDAWEPRGEKET